MSRAHRTRTRPAPRGVEVVAAGADRWPAIEELFGPRGACAGCWCMWYRQRQSEFEARKGAPNRRAMQRIVRSGVEPGVLALHAGRPVGWCAVAPRSEYGRLSRSRVLAPVDDREVFSLPCFFVHKEWRGRGLTRKLIQGALDLARGRGARWVEAYPIAPRKREVPDLFAFTGFLSTFERCGFREVERRSPTRPIVRRQVRPRRS